MKLKFVPQDCWIGTYWKREKSLTTWYLCLIPCFPLIWQTKTGGILVLALALVLFTGCRTPRKPCQVERVCFEHREEMLKMLEEHKATTMELLRTIAALEEETGHYQ